MLSCMGGSSELAAKRTPAIGHMEVAIMVDDVYDREMSERISAQEAVWQDRLLPELEWDETEDARVVEELLGRSNLHDAPA